MAEDPSVNPSSAAAVEQQLQAQIEAIAAAARDFGVLPHDLEGRFVTAWLDSLRWQARLITGLVDDLRAVVAGGRELAGAEIARLQEYNRHAALSIEGARAAQANLEAQHETVLARVVEAIVAELSVEIGRWRVLRQAEWNKRQSWRLAAGATAIGVSLLITGYACRAVADEDSVLALQRCAEHAVVDARAGRAYCDVTYLGIVPDAEK
jgi:hypothetical protein